MKILSKCISTTRPLPILARSLLISTSLVAAGLGVSSVWAADSTWQGDVEVDGLFWSVPENWSNGVPGTVGTTTNPDTATFGLVDGGLIILDQDYNLKNLTFSAAAGDSTVDIEADPFATDPQVLHLSSGGSITVQAAVADNSVITLGPSIVLEGASPTTNGTYTITNVAKATDNYATAARLNIIGNISGGATTGSITLTLSGSVGSRSLAATAGNQISGVISDGDAAGGLSVVVTSKSAAQGSWYLAGLNTFTGNITLSPNSVLFFNSIANAGEASALGAGNTVTLGSGTFLMYTGGAGTTNRTFLVNGASWFNSGSGTITISSGGRIQLTNSLTFRGNANFIVDGLITGNGSITRTDGGTVFLNNVNNDFNGSIGISTGAFNVASVANSLVASAIGKGSAISLGQSNGGTSLANNIGRLIVSSSSNQSTNRTINIINGLSGTTAVGGGIIENSVASTTLTLAGNVTTSAATLATLELTGVGNGVLTGITSGSKLLSLTKSGAGVWELRGANTHTGTNTITGGTLLATNTTGSATGTGSVTVASGGTLGGTGTIAPIAGNSLTFASGSTLMVGNTTGTAVGAVASNGYTGAVSTLTLGANAAVPITLGGNLQFDLFGGSDGVTNGTSDLLKVLTTGTITLGGTVSVSDLGGNTNWRSGGSAGWSTGTWQFIDWSGASSATQSGDFTYNLPTTSLAIGYTWDTSHFLTNGTLSVVAIADSAIHKWLGTTSNSWGDAANWTAGTVPGAADDVIFAGPINPEDIQNVATLLNGDRNVRNLVFTSTASNYSISSGSAGVVYVRGDATNGATIEVDGGVQTINADVRLGDSSSNAYFINNSVSPTGANTLIFTTVTANDFDSGVNVTNKLLTISGAGNTLVGLFQRRHNTYDLTLVKNGTGTLTISGSTAADATANGTGTFTGSTTINQGTIRISQERALGGNPTDFDAGHLTLNGGTLGAFGTFAIDDPNRGVTLGANGGTFSVEGANSLTIANVITGPGSLTKTGATGTLSLSAANTYTGDTFVTEGTLNVANTTGSATSTGSVIVTGTSAMLSGSGFVTGSEGKAITIAADGLLRIGNNHNNVAGTASTLTLGSNANVAITLAGGLQFDLFANQHGALPALGDQLILQSTASSITLGGTAAVAAPVANGIFISGTWKLIDWSGVSTATRNGTLGIDMTNATNALASGFAWDTSKFLTDGTVSVVATADANIWTGGSGSSPSWQNGANWQSGNVPANFQSSTTTSDVVFAGLGTYPTEGNTIVTNIAQGTDADNFYVRNIFFTGEQNYTVQGSKGVLYAEGSLLRVDGGTQVISAQIRPTGTGSYNIYNDGTLTFGSTIMANNKVDIVFDGAGQTTVSSISRRGNTVNNIVKNGSGTVTITSFNALDGDTDPLGYTASGSAIKGTTTINAGTIRINDERNLGINPNAFNAAQLTLNGGTLSAYADVTMDDTNRGFTLGAKGGTLAAEGAFTLTIANVITGPGALIKAGTGTLALTALNNTYTGATTINAGTLLVSGSISGSAVTVNNTGTLGGDGGTTGAVTVNAGGLLSPGVGIGALNTVGAATFNAGSTFKLEIDTTAATTDLLAITGDFSLASTNDVVLAITDLTPAQFNSGEFTFISYTGVWNGGLFSYNGNVIGDGGALSIGGNQYFLDYDYGGNSVALLTVPEPGSLVPLVSGLGILLGWNRSRRRRA